MSSAFFLLFCACVVGLASASTKPRHYFQEEELHFERFIRDHNKQYADEHEKQARFQIFRDNLGKVNELNKKHNTTSFVINQFMDLTIEEFRRKHTGLKVGESSHCTYIYDADIPDANAPESFDWRENNGVTPIQDQRSCGSCYAFSAIGNIESQYLIKNGVALDLAEQQIVDCDSNSAGCGGGLMSFAFGSIIEAGGIESEENYPYIGRSQHCALDANEVVVKLASCNSYLLDSQEKLKQLLYSYGPVSIAIKADGIMHIDGVKIIEAECETGAINHAVLLVGYGDDNGVPYWIVKNSWGTTWGNQGYFKVKRGDNTNSCGLMNNMMAGSVLA